MPARNDAKERLAKSSEIKITVTGRKSRRPISVPVWFVWEGNELYLLPVHGSETQWYKNVLKNPKIRVEASGAEFETEVVSVKDAKKVASVAEKFRTKYGAADVKKYYSRLDVAVVAEIA